ncbi:MAG: hypothetical protein ACHQ2Z_05585 [Elusimicrobiota bacterium]
MLRPEVVQYLRDNLPKFSVDALRRQLHEEGVSEIDFEHCLADALRGPKAAPTSRPKPSSSRASRLALVGGIALITGVVLYVLSQKTAAPAAPPESASASGESGFVGAHGWVVRLPKDYVGVSEFKDSSKTDEIVHFAKRGTDATNFLDEGLYGQMGIVRLEVAPSQFPPNMTGAASLAAAVQRKTSSHGEKFVMKTVQIGTLPGVQVNVQSPFPRVEAYILGQNDLYFFSGGEENEIWRDIVLSLRDAHSEE